MSRWNDAEVLANSESLTAGTPVSADTSELRNPTVLVNLEDLEGNADDTATIRVVGDAGTYPLDQRTLGGVSGADGTYDLDIPQAASVEFESSNGVTYSVEVRGDPE